MGQALRLGLGTGAPHRINQHDVNAKERDEEFYEFVDSSEVKGEKVCTYCV